MTGEKLFVKLDAEFFASEIDKAKAVRYALQAIVDYRRRVGVLGFQVEKFDELVRRAVVALEKQ